MTRQGEMSVAIWFLMAALMLLLAFQQSCATTDAGQKKFDPCAAMTYAQGSHAIAHGTSLIVCSAIKDKAKRAQCLSTAAADLVLTLGANVLKACGL